MERMRQIYSEQIEPYTDTFGRLSRRLMQASVLASVLSAMLTKRRFFSTIRSPNRVLTPFEKCFEDAFGTVCSAFRNLRLGGVNCE